MSTWHSRYQNIKTSSYYDTKELYDEYRKAGSSEVGISGKNGAGIFIRDNGCVDIYAKEGVGISIDPNLDSVSIFGAKVNINSKEVDIYTNILGLRWNKFPLNLTPIMPPGQGTILPSNTAISDAGKYITKILGKLVP